MSDFRKVRLVQNHGPDTHFEGRLVHEYSTQNRDGSKSRWTELRLWETRGGAWVAESCGCSTVGNERELREVTVIEEVDLVAETEFRPDGSIVRGPRISEDPDQSGRKRAVMQAFGWTTAAKAFARELGWDVVRRVG